MTNILNYLEKINYDNKILNSNIFDSYEYFYYFNLESFQIDLEFLLSTIYNEIKIQNNYGNKKRLSQNEFRTQLLNLYESKCVVSSNFNPDELEASHIVEVADGGDYELSNGLILEANLHKTFDRYQWTINPDTLEIEIKNNIICGNICNGSINKYVGKKINLDMNPFLYSNLKKRYNKFFSNN